ncbi:MAG: site-2 protease family protein [Dethiobacteria bacterium]|jgi:Zn-dependent protease
MGGTEMLFRIPALLIAITFHEYAHARMAYAWGDPTAKLQGRLTLNPLAHLDPLGLLMLWILRFGWAKPVPINPRNFKDPRKGLFWVSFAGPGTNLILGLIATFLLVVFWDFGVTYRIFMENIIIFNVFLAVFNIVPLPPLDGSKILSTLLPPKYRYYYYAVEPYGPFLLIIMLVFGLLPIFLLPISNFIITFFRNIVLFFLRF